MKNIFLLLLVNLSKLTTYSSHIRAGEITAKRLGCNGYDYEFTLTAYRDSGGNIQFGNGIFNFGNGESISLNPDGYSRKEVIADGVELVQFKFTI